MTALPRRTVLGAAALSALAAGTAAGQSGGGGGQGNGGPPPPSSAEQGANTPADPKRPLIGKVALVTGGARGIGRACGLELARMGADVALADIADPAQLRGVLDYPLASRGDLAEAGRQVEALGRRSLITVADVRRFDQLERAVGQASSTLGGVDVLVAVAGVNLGDDTLASYSDAKWNAIIETNVHGVLNSVRAALPAMRRRPGGRIIIISSLAGRRGSEENLIYSTSKWAVTGLMKCLAAELGPEGIAVNAVAPSGVDTVLFEKGRPQPQVEEESARGHVLPVSILDPVDIARAVGFLAGPGGKWMSGATIDVNAGRSSTLTG